MKLVVEEKIKTIEKSGDENLINTSETVSKIENIVVKETILPANNVKLTLDEETFLSKIENQDGEYIFEYDDERGWFNGDEDIDLSEYGISLDNTPKSLDLINIVVIDGEVTSKIYYLSFFVVEDIYCNFFDFSSELPVKMDFTLFVDENERVTTLENTTKAQVNFAPKHLRIIIWYVNTKDFKIKLVVSK